jgi:hypothetical protein
MKRFYRKRPGSEYGASISDPIRHVVRKPQRWQWKTTGSRLPDSELHEKAERAQDTALQFAATARDVALQNASCS